MPLSQLNWQAAREQKPWQTYCYNTQIGSLAILMQGELLCKLQWLMAPEHEIKNKEPPAELEHQLNQYWLTASFALCTALLQQGTEFQQKVWHTLCRIPAGQTKTYGQLAEELNTSPRALANACRKNPFPLIIPCHRVLAKTGLGGYAGATSGKLINIKAALLQHEKMMTHEL